MRLTLTGLFISVYLLLPAKARQENVAPDSALSHIEVKALDNLILKVLNLYSKDPTNHELLVIMDTIPALISDKKRQDFTEYLRLISTNPKQTQTAVSRDDELIILKKYLNTHKETQDHFNNSLSYLLCLSNQFLKQFNQEELNRAFAKQVNFKPVELFLDDFDTDKIYDRRLIANDICDFLIANYMNALNETTRQKLFILTTLLSPDSQKLKNLSLANRYNLPLSFTKPYPKKLFLSFLKKTIHELHPSEFKEDNILAEVLNDIHFELTQKWLQKPKIKWQDYLSQFWTQILFKSPKNTSTIKGLITSPHAEAQVIAIRATHSYNQDVPQVLFSQDQSPQLQDSLNLALLANQALKDSTPLKHKLWIHFSLKQLKLNGYSAGLPLAVLIASQQNGVLLSSDTVLTGSFNSLQKVSVVGGIPAKIKAAIKAKCKYMLLPIDNQEMVNDYAILYETDSLYGLQVLGVTSLEESLHLAQYPKPSPLNKASLLFEQLKNLDKNTQIISLENILKLVPNHLSAQVLLKHLQNQSPSQLSFAGSLELIKQISTQALSQKNLPLTHITKASAKLEFNKKIFHHELQDYAQQIVLFLRSLIKIRDKAVTLQERQNFILSRKKLLQMGLIIDQMVKERKALQQAQ
jgi:hypothetical protein